MCGSRDNWKSSMVSKQRWLVCFLCAFLLVQLVVCAEKEDVKPKENEKAIEVNAEGKDVKKDEIPEHLLKEKKEEDTDAAAKAEAKEDTDAAGDNTEQADKDTNTEADKDANKDEAQKDKSSKDLLEEQRRIIREMGEDLKDFKVGEHGELEGLV